MPHQFRLAACVLCLSDTPAHLPPATEEFYYTRDHLDAEGTRRDHQFGNS